MNILLTPELEQFVNERVEKGEYTDALSVISAGLRLLSERRGLMNWKKISDFWKLKCR